MREIRDRLAGHEVTSRWINLRDGDYPEYSAETLNSDPQSFSAYAETDIADIHAADTIVSFTGGGGKGGRHVEFGLGIALGKRLVVIGPREHVFHTLPQVEQYPDLESFLLEET